MVKSFQIKNGMTIKVFGHNRLCFKGPAAGLNKKATMKGKKKEKSKVSQFYAFIAIKIRLTVSRERLLKQL